MSDFQLIRRIRRGDEAAWNELYRRYLPIVWRYAYAKSGGQQHVAEDAVGEAFLALIRSAEKLNHKQTTISGWLITVVSRRLTDHWRRESRARLEGSSEDSTILGRELDPADSFVAAERRTSVLSVLDQLSDEQRLVLEWKYIDGLSVREIAQRLDRSEKAIESLLLRARRAFRTLFETHEANFAEQETG